MSIEAIGVGNVLAAGQPSKNEGGRQRLAADKSQVEENPAPTAAPADNVMVAERQAPPTDDAAKAQPSPPPVDRGPQTRSSVLFDDPSGLFVLRSIDVANGDVVHQFPPEQVIRRVTAFIEQLNAEQRKSIDVDA